MRSRRIITPSDDPSTIIGLACRVPGAENPSQLWRLIEEQRDVLRQIPENRFRVDSFYHPDGTNKGTTNVRYGYFLDQDISKFDAGFFNISGKEAEAMDPQQRLLLEVVYEALEDAGISLEDISGTQTSVFCGSFSNDYNAMTSKDLESYPKYTAIGTGNSMLANRISFFYNLRGASVTIDTACSSSLVCFHMGNQSLRTNESDISIVVGSALHFDPNIFITISDLGMLSIDGRSRAFDEFGKGYARGEGICAAILKRKSEAELDGNTIRAIVRGSLTSHDGRKQSITLPSSAAQEQLIRQTYQNARLDPADTHFFEAHGTGTPAGDPREARAIGAIFAPNRKRKLMVGSVKTTIGHLEGASGLAGIIKATLSLENRKIPPNMHFSNPNPEILFEDYKIEIPTKMTDWEASNNLRRASINSFGYGGTNAHVILEGYYPSKDDKGTEGLPSYAKVIDERPYLLPLTSHSETAGKLWIRSLAGYLEKYPATRAQDLAHSLSSKRSMHRYRSFVIGSDQETLLKELADPSLIAAWAASNGVNPRIGFVFTGQGVQWFAMGRKLIEQSPLFRHTLERCDRILQQLSNPPDWSIIDEILQIKEASYLAQTRFSQPICTALQLAILALLNEWNIKPSAVVGHSSGELAAAFAAGILSFENCLVAAYYRGIHMSNLTNNPTIISGAMMAIGMTKSEAMTELELYKGRLVIAAINSPSSITVSGDTDAIFQLKEQLIKRKIFARQLEVAQAFHSHHMLPLAPDYERVLGDHPGFKSQAAKIRMFSSVNARLANPQKMDAKYWAANVTGTVRFSDALTGIILDDADQQSIDVLVEIGPHPVLKGPSLQVMQSLNLKIPYLSSLTRGTLDYQELLATAGQLFMLGHPVDLIAVNSDHFIDHNRTVSRITSGQRLQNLPSYSWDHSRYWSETRVIKNHRLRKDRHVLLGACVPDSVEFHPRWRNYLRLNELPWLAEHIVEGEVVFPAAGYICMAIEAITRMGRHGTGFRDIILCDIAIKVPLVLSDSEAGTEIILELRPLPMSTTSDFGFWCEFIIFSFNETATSTEHCRGLVSTQQESPASTNIMGRYASPEELERNTDRRTTLQNHYQHLEEIGLRYGESFRLLSGEIKTRPGFAVAPLTFDGNPIAHELLDTFILHPTLLDASFHVIFAAIGSGLGEPLHVPFIPTFIKSMRVSGVFLNNAVARQMQNFHVCSRAEVLGSRAITSDLHIYSDDRQQLIVDVQGLKLTALNNNASAVTYSRSLFFRTRWLPAFDFLGTSKYFSIFKGIADVMDSFAHQNPDSKILHLTSDLESSIKALSLLGGRQGVRRRFRSYTPYPALAIAMFEGFNALKDIWLDLIEIGEPKPGWYDMVIVEENSHCDIEKYLKPDGYILTDGVKVEVNGYSVLFHGSKFCAWRKRQVNPDFTKPLTIVLAPAICERTRALATLIETAYNGPVSKTTLEHLARNSITSSNVVILTTLDQDPFYDDLSHGQEDFEAVRTLFVQHGMNVVWLLAGATLQCQKPEHAIIFGLARVARSENDQIRLVTLDVPPAYSVEIISQRTLQVLNENISEDEFSERDGTLFIPRVEADDALNSKLWNGVNGGPRLQHLEPGRPLSLRIAKAGSPENLAFADDEAFIVSDIQDDEIEIEVKASAISLRDIAVSTGVIDGFRLGDQCAGLVIRKGAKVEDSVFGIGDRVVAWRPDQGAHCTIVRNPAALCSKLGPLSYAEAAALPCSLMIAYYALYDLSRLKLGETVLIHSATEGVGQMAIQIAQSIGATVMATVSSQSQRDLLKRRYSLLDDQIFSARDDSFMKEIVRLTQSNGVHVVLNNLADQLLHATLGCLRPFGRFVEINKQSSSENARLNVGFYEKNVVFASIDRISMFENDKSLGARIFQECWQLVQHGKIAAPETMIEFSYADVAKGFRLSQANKKSGPVILVPNQNDMVPVTPSKYQNVRLFNPLKVYLLVGGLGGLGRTIAEWLTRKGAKHLAFLSRSAADGAGAKAVLQWLQNRGIKITLFRGDVADFETVKSCIQSLGPGLAGIFQAAMVLRDSTLDQMTYNQWCECLRPKVRGTYHLHQASLTSHLDFFVCLSSVSSILGSKGQASYCAANSYLDALMCHRREIGLKGTTINCGMVDGAGVVAQNVKLQRTMEWIGYDTVSEQEFLYQLEEAISTNHSMTPLSPGIGQHQIITGINISRKDLYWAQKPLLRNIYANYHFGESDCPNLIAQNLKVLLHTAMNPDRRLALLIEAFVQEVASILAVPSDVIELDNSLSAYGLDSLTAMDIRNWFARAVGVDLTLFDVLGAKSIIALTSKAASLIVIAASSNYAKNEETADKNLNNNTVETAADVKETLSTEIAILPKHGKIPMSTFQRRLWFLHNMAENKSLLNLSVVFHMKGTPTFALVREALIEMKKRNDILRTAYFEGEYFAEQRLIDDVDVRLEYRDFSSSEHPYQSLENHVKTLQSSELSIGSGAVMTPTLTKLNGSQHALVLVLHHISIDRGSSKSFLSQFVAIYDSVRSQKILLHIPSPKITYSQFSIWHNALLQSSSIELDMKFWVEKLAGSSGLSGLLPFAKVERRPQSDFERAAIKGRLDIRIFNRMKRVCRQMNATPFQYLLTAFRAFIYRYTGEKDLTILTMDGNRPHPDLDDVLGFFVNIIPIRCTNSCDTEFDILLEDIRNVSLEAMRHSKVPFDSIVHALKIEKSASHFPLGQIILNYQIHGTMPIYSTADFDIHKVSSEDIPTSGELSLEVIEHPIDGLNIRLEYSTTLYEKEDMDCFFDNFITFITDSVKDHRQPISEIEITGAKEIIRLKRHYWATRYTENQWTGDSVLETIMKLAQVHPRMVAIITSEGEIVTYESLLDRARRIGFTLQRMGASPGRYIGLFSRPGVETIASMLGILLNRCAYVPMDPEFAIQRLTFMAENSNVMIILVGQGLKELAKELALRSDNPVPFVSIAEAALTRPKLSLPESISPGDPFYIVYTSGSTGEPKGVTIRQSNVQQMLSTLQDAFKFTAQDSFLHHTSICFDLSCVQIFSALTSGGTICSASVEVRKDPLLLADFMQRSSVSITYFTPTQFASLLECAPGMLKNCAAYRLAFLAGEILQGRVVKTFYDLNISAKLYNAWGPSELTVQTTMHKVAYDDINCRTVPIGFPISNCRHYIVDSHLRPLPVGLIGELCVGGAQVADGYINRPGANAESFVEDLFCSPEDRNRGWKKMFKTGDRARFRAGGEIEFRGRIAGDKQIKLRGFRMDLGEIEHRIYSEAMSVQKFVGIAVVARNIGTTHSSITDDRQLVAFVSVQKRMTAAEKQTFVSVTNQKIGEYLNAYMIPYAYHFLDHLPITIGGKLDIRNLINRELDVVHPSALSNALVLTESDTKVLVEGEQFQLITKSFREVLKLTDDFQIAPTDNFFELGGQSILLLRLLSKIKRHLNVSLPLSDVFKEPTPAAVYRLVSSKARGILDDEKRNSVHKMINWDDEATLPSQGRYLLPRGARPRNPSDVSIVLLTGVDSFIGIHVLARILSAQKYTKVYVLGTNKIIGFTGLTQKFKIYGLFDGVLTEASLLSTVQFVPGKLAEFHFGLGEDKFKELGKTVQIIYHLGSQVSLLKTYTDLKQVNVSSTLDMIELSTQGDFLTDIHLLSTWSVPHLQSWPSTKRTQNSIITAETSTDHFSPAETDELGYFKSRWVAEKLMTQAAARGFSISIYRPVAVTASTATNAPEVTEDLVRDMVVDMIETRQVPRIDHQDAAFVIDFIPVDHLASIIYALSRRGKSPTEASTNQPAIFHIGSPSPLLLRDLPGLVAEIRHDDILGCSLALGNWLQSLFLPKNEDGKSHERQHLQWTALKTYLRNGHIMFALDASGTKIAMQKLTMGGDAKQTAGFKCPPAPPIDANFLRKMWIRAGRRTR